MADDKPDKPGQMARTVPTVDPDPPPDDPELSIECPTCGTPPGRPCWSLAPVGALVRTWGYCYARGQASRTAP